MIRPKHMSRSEIASEIAKRAFNPNSYDNLSNEAENCVRNKDWIEAIYILDQIIEDYGATGRLYLNRSICQYRLQEYQHALYSLELALEQNTEFTEAMVLKLAIEEKLAKLRKYYGVQMYG